MIMERIGNLMDQHVHTGFGKNDCSVLRMICGCEFLWCGAC